MSNCCGIIQEKGWKGSTFCFDWEKKAVNSCTDNNKNKEANVLDICTEEKSCKITHAEIRKYGSRNKIISMLIDQCGFAQKEEGRRRRKLS